MLPRKRHRCTARTKPEEQQCTVRQSQVCHTWNTDNINDRSMSGAIKVLRNFYRRATINVSPITKHYFAPVCSSNVKLYLCLSVVYN